MTTQNKKSAYARMGDKLAQFGLASPAVSEARDIETITSEILTLKKTAGEAILAIGQRLIEAKSLLAHGEWLPWLTEQVEFSERTAQNFMRLSREWSNPQTLADLGAAKALALLALPEPEREEFMAEVPAEDMSVRELEKAIRERNEARQAQEKMSEDLKLANELLERAVSERESASESIAELERQLAELKSRPVDVAIMEVDQEKLAAARAEAKAEMQSKLARAQEEKKKAEEALAAANQRVAAFEAAHQEVNPASDEELAVFNVLLNQTRENINKMVGLLMKLQGRDDPSAAESVRNELLELSGEIWGWGYVDD